MMTPESKKPGIFPAWDPLGYKTELMLHADYYPLGFPVRLTTNSEEVLGAAEASWGGFQEQFSEPSCNLRVIVSQDPVTEPPPAPSFRAHEHLMVLAADRRHFGVVDLEKRLVSCWVSASEVERGEWFQYYYLEGACYALLNHLYLTPIHASCVAHRGRGVLFCGKSGSGKSVLAYSCARQGLTFVSDAATYLVRQETGGKAMGNPRFLKLLPSAATLFPELKNHAAAPGVDGKAVFRLAMDQLENMTIATGCEVDHVIFLDRRPGGKADLEPIDSDTALARLVEELPRFGDEAAQAHVHSLKRLVKEGACVLRYESLQAATERVVGLLSEGFQ